MEVRFRPLFGGHFAVQHWVRGLKRLESFVMRKLKRSVRFF